MKRINTPTAVGGKFVDGNEREQKATQFSAEWCNQVQEELCNLIKKWTGAEPTGLSDHELADAVAKFTRSNPLIIKTDVVQGSYHKVTIDGSSIKVEQLDTNDDVHESTVIDDYTVKIRKEFADGYEDYVVGRIDGNNRGVQVARTVTGSSGSTRTATVKNSSVTVTASGQGGFSQTKVESGIVELTNSDNDKITIDLTDGVVNKVTGSGASEQKSLELPNNFKVSGYTSLVGLGVSGQENHGGSETHTGSETHSGVETHNGDEVHGDTGTHTGSGKSTATFNKKVLFNDVVDFANQGGIGSIKMLIDDNPSTRSSKPILVADDDIDITNYDYPAGSVIRILNYKNGPITVLGVGTGSCQIEQMSFREFIRYDGDWYKSNSLPEVQ